MSRAAVIVLIGLFWVPARPETPALSRDVRQAIEMAECALESKNAALDRLEQRIVDLDCRRAAERLAGAVKSLSLVADSAARARSEARAAAERAADARVSAAEAEAERRLDALRRSHAGEIEELERAHAERIETLKRSHAAEIEALERTQADALAAAEAAADQRARDAQKAAALAMRAAANTSKEAVAALKQQSDRTARRSRALERASADRDAARAEVEKLSALLAKRERAYRELLSRVQTYVRQTDSLPGSLAGSLAGSAAASPRAGHGHATVFSPGLGGLFSPPGAVAGLPPPSPSQRTFSRTSSAGLSGASLFSPGSQASPGFEATPKARQRSLSRYAADEAIAGPEAVRPSPVPALDSEAAVTPASSIETLRTPAAKTPLAAQAGSSAGASSLAPGAARTPLSVDRRTPASATPRPRSAANAAAEALLAKAAAGAPLVGTLAELSPGGRTGSSAAAASPQRGAPVDPAHLSAKIAWLAGAEDDDEGIRALRASHEG